MNDHGCPVLGCTRKPGVTRWGVRMLMCGPHWHRVTPKTRRDLWRAYGAMMRATIEETVRDYNVARRQAIAEAGRLSTGTPQIVENSDPRSPKHRSTIPKARTPDVSLNPPEATNDTTRSRPW